MKLRTLGSQDVRGKRVILRVTFDVHFNLQHGKRVVEDDARIKDAVPMIRELSTRGAKVILLSWLQRPKGKRVPEMDMTPVGERLEELLGTPVTKLDDCVGDDVRQQISRVPDGSVVLLENVRFHPGEKDEKTYDEVFAKELAANGDLFVNDAFGQSHRDVASISGIPKFLPSFAGQSLEREVRELSALLENPARPFVAVIGGAKISSKLGVIKQLLDKADALLLGGALANTILRAKNVQVGKSLIEEHMVEVAKELPLTDPRLHIPVDVITAKEPTSEASTRLTAVGRVEDDERILDIGPDTVRLFTSVLATAKTVMWNGPMGYFELDTFAKATDAIATFLATSTAKTVVGGGETIASLHRVGAAEKMSFTSMGGGAMLEFIEKGTLPGIEPLRLS